ncbi:hypothetical protein Q5752_001593 [Cryptotrichosporon argae]
MNGDNDLRCNILNCRVELAKLGQGVVTTCSPDDSAIGFWTYQASQERQVVAEPAFGPAVDDSAFQNVRLRNVKGQIAEYEKQKGLHFADMQAAQEKISDLEKEADTLRRRIGDLVNDAKNKDQEITKMRSELNKLKRKVAVGNVDAATTANALDGPAPAQAGFFSGRLVANVRRNRPPIDFARPPSTFQQPPQYPPPPHFHPPSLNTNRQKENMPPPSHLSPTMYRQQRQSFGSRTSNSRGPAAGQYYPPPASEHGSIDQRARKGGLPPHIRGHEFGA